VLQGATDSPEVLERFHAELALVDIIASQVARSLGISVEFDDLLSAGREGLLDAARRYDQTRGVPFRAYANLRVRGAVIDGVRQHSRLPRRAHERLCALEASGAVSEGEIPQAFADTNQHLAAGDAERRLTEHLANMATAAAVACGMNSDDKSSNGHPESARNPEKQFEQAELLEIIRRNIDDLAPGEAGVIRAYYFEDKSFAEIADRFNFSKSWVCRLHTQAMSRLTKVIKDSL
jgi:RNA polymerase sigma factor for flagellar operon FliA